ncbi:hypothetical protein [Aquabacterium sp.]|jgi:hypothetical protein|uniref:hypothetical protein n=1 Tax=Aquabacterium sp. TaxID=1872578 RepID=UPI0025C508D2|nr:hypothetical protein [Aquabacterium sp.]
MGIVVYWLSQGQPFAQGFTDAQLLDALAFAEARRKDKTPEGQRLNGHVSISTELGDAVGLPGVSDQLPPDYSWSKSHRGGPPGPEGTPKTLA